MPLISLKDSLATTIEEVTLRTEGKIPREIGIPTGFTQLNEAIGGFRKNAIYMLAGRTGLGKTALAMTFAVHAARLGYGVLYMSYEMDARLLALRTISGLTQISTQNIEYGRLNKEELLRVQETVGAFEGLTFAINDSMMTSYELHAFIERHKKENALDLLIIDHLSLHTDRSNFGETDRVTSIMRNVRHISNTFDIAVMPLAQLNREVERREGHYPTLSDLKQSGAQEEDASAVLFVYRPHYYAMMNHGEPPLEIERNAKLLISKNRHGPSGIALPLNFHPKEMRWSDDNAPTSPPPSIKQKYE